MTGRCCRSDHHNGFVSRGRGRAETAGCQLHGPDTADMFHFAPGFRDTGDSEEEAGLAVCPELTRAMEGVKYIAEVTRIMEDSNKVTADSLDTEHCGGGVIQFSAVVNVNEA